MRELLPGFWVPDKDKTGWMLKHEIIDGIPSYSYIQIQASIEACGKRRGLAIDGGAHLGFWTCRLVRHFEKVIAIEPILSNFECLQKNLSGFRNAELVNIAIGNSDEPLGMKDCREGRSVGWRVDSDTPDIYVPCRKIDDLFSGDRALDFLKLDLDGYDYEALLGAEKTILRDRPVVVIEEKLDPEKRCMHFLTEIGMLCIQSWKNDRLFVWS